MSVRRVFLLAGVVLVLEGCHARVQAPDLGRIYSRSAMQGEDVRNPVIVIPGILGSKLAVAGSGRLVWGIFGGEYANPATPEGARLLALPMAEGKALSELVDDIEEAGSLDRVKVSLFGLPIEQNAYLNILGTLGVGGYRDRTLARAGAVDYGPGHFTCFQFAYDWRRDLSENAVLLHEFLESTREYVEEERRKQFGEKSAPVKFDIVAHSMGGLLTRYYLRYGAKKLDAAGDMPEVTWEGAEHVRRAILIGTPNAGSLNSLLTLVNGVDFVPLFPHYPAAILGTMPAVYQLLPRVRHRALVGEGAAGVGLLDHMDPELWRSLGWGLADDTQASVLETLLPDIKDASTRRRIAFDHLSKCLRQAQRFHAALDVPAKRPDGLDLVLIAGDAVSTPAVAAVNVESGALRVDGNEPGDGTVIRASALMDERLDGEWSPRLRSPVDWSRVLFIFSDHLGLTRDPGFTDNVLYHLLEEPM